MKVVPFPKKIFDSWDEAVDHWSPGQSFDFVARQVPAKMRELSLEELLQAMDPDGSFRQQAKSAGISMPDETIKSLKDMANENVRRTEMSPRDTVTEEEAFSGVTNKRGYEIINADNLTIHSMNTDGTENEDVLMHVMDAFANHGCLIVDVTNGGTTFEDATTVARMWNAVGIFFDSVSLDEKLEKIPYMSCMDEVGSPHAKLGFASYQEGNMQFLETRLHREGVILPREAISFVGQPGCEALIETFRIVAEVGKNIVRIVMGASTRETGLLDGEQAARAAVLATNELLDDGQSINTSIEHSEGKVSMSPHRLCLYTNQLSSTNDNAESSKMFSTPSTKEIFGAHTDSTFVTAVPVAAISGLEVYDEDSAKWFRPEKAARLHFQKYLAGRGMDLNALTEDVDGTDIPWYSRYIVFMPGEMLQLCSRNECMAAVHRVVTNVGKPSRLSAPVLLRGRPGVKLDARRYLGGLASDDFLLRSCDGLTLEDIHDAMQPSRSKKKDKNQ